MTQEEKELLLGGWYARLPYGVIVETPKGKGHICDINLTISGGGLEIIINPDVIDTFSINDVKPYLFPLSSMTEEQKKDLDNIVANSRYDENIVYDWYNKNNFDYRGLIPIGLAIDATGLNIY